MTKNNTRLLRFKRWVAGMVLAAGLPLLAHAESLCAVVKIEIKQELTFERQGFEGVMRIQNNLDAVDLTSVRAEVYFANANNERVDASGDSGATGAAFYLRLDANSGVEGLTDDAAKGSVTNGTIKSKTTGELRWLMIPTANAVGNADALYYVGATLTYIANGKEETVEVTPDFITVKPLPKLQLDYFLQKDVFGDDPFTQNSYEPAEPFNLGVRITNSGYGAAGKVKIESAQPEIVDNQQHLLYDLKITGSYVGNQAVSNSLLVNFGDLMSGDVRAGRWVLESSLSGLFKDFKSTYTHADSLGGEMTSILSAVVTHTLIHEVLVDLPNRDTVRDFLSPQTLETIAVFESERTGVNPEGLGCFNCMQVDNHQGELSSLSSENGFERKRLTITGNTESPNRLGWIKVIDPSLSGKILAYAVRKDGKRLAIDNAWIDKARPNPDANWDAIDYSANIFDYDITSDKNEYTLYFKNSITEPQAPVFQPVLRRVVMEGEQVGTLIRSSDPNGTVPQISAGSLPLGASFEPDGNGNGYFRWFTQFGQAGLYKVRFTATDGALSSTQTMQIIVLREGQTEADYVDGDGDGFTVADGDTNDNNRDIFPGAADICGNGADEDGDGQDAICEPQFVADGDVNIDGVVDLKDLLLVQSHLLRGLVLTPEQIGHGDLFPAQTGDGKIEPADLLLLQNKIMADINTPLDSDGDLLPDAWESANGLNPNDAADVAQDSDNDGLSNAQEHHYKTNPQAADSDADGINDGQEISSGTKPADAADFPAAIVSVPPTVAGVGYAYSYMPFANSMPADYELISGPEGMEMVDGFIEWTPTFAQSGMQSVTVRALIGDKPSVPQTYQLRVVTGDGDINDDGNLDTVDLIFMQRFIMDEITPEMPQRYRADMYPVNSPDGEINPSDLILFEQTLLGGE